MFEVGKTYKTLDGSTAELTGTSSDEGYAVEGVILLSDGQRVSSTWTADGRYDRFALPNQDWDLVSTIPVPASVLSEIQDERGRQDERWGTQNHSPADWYAILGEEFGEVGKAVCEMKVARDKMNRDGFEIWVANYREELIQTAAVCVAMVECLDRNK